MKKIISTVLCAMTFTIATASVERNLLSANFSTEIISESLLHHQKWVPYPDYSDRESWDNFLGDNKSQLILKGEKKLNYTWQVIRATDYIEYELSGNRNIMQNPNSDNNNALSDLVMAELAEGNGRFINQIINGVFYNCERTSWVLSAHLPAQKSKRTLPETSEQVIDLGSGEIGAFLSWTYYFFKQEFDKVNPEISRRLYAEIYNKIILPYRKNNHYWWMAFDIQSDRVVNNWNPWCNFNVLQSMLLLETDPVQTTKDIRKTMLSVDKFINYVNEDGACEEGPSYWGHAAGKLYDYLQMLSLATDGKISIFDQPMIKNMGEYISRSYIGNNWVVNFADASASFSSEAPLIYRYGKAINSDEMKGFATLLSAKKTFDIGSGTDIFRILESLKYDEELRSTTTVHKTPEVTIYPETQFYYFKNKSDFFLATKGGFNAESHNHNDAGTFSLWYNQTPIFIDAGVGTYTRQTFGPERYNIWTMRSIYHNLASINGTEQQFGRKFKATNIKVDAKNKLLSMNIATAYPAEASAKYWYRTYQLTDYSLIIHDKFSLKNNTTPNEIHFMLHKRPKLLLGKIEIEADRNILQMTFDDYIFETTIETIHLDDIRLSKVWGNEIYRLTLREKKTQSKGNYKFVVSIVK
jgi:hypothetical protein